MILFKPDFFSYSQPEWLKYSHKLTNELNQIISYLIPKKNHSNIIIEYSGALEVNSLNFKISFANKSYVIKKWPSNYNYRDLLAIEKTILHLINDAIPSPKIISFINGDTIIKLNNSFWTCAEFIEGSYFSGKDSELDEMSFYTSKIANSLSRLPNDLTPKNKINYELNHEVELIQKIENSEKEWKSIFKEISPLLSIEWKSIIIIYNKLKNQKICKGPTLVSHYDLHPFNLLFSKNKLVSLLDFDSIINIPIGQSIAYSALKQCRQTICYSQDLSKSSIIGKRYLESLKLNLNIGDISWTSDLTSLAQLETLRRIFTVLKLNLDGNNKWNKVFPTLISNLHEAKKIFG